MSEVINGYTLLTPLTNKDAGNSRWAHAEKAGREYFIKELIEKKYPTKDSTYDPEMRRMNREACERYEAAKADLYWRIGQASDGNLVRVEEFFRWGGTYYVVTEWVDGLTRFGSADAPSSVTAKRGERLGIADLSRLKDDWRRVRCCLALSHALMGLHRVNIVHGDLKPSNIILARPKVGAGGVAPKIIDMDSSFDAGHPPDEFGDQVYCAPESILYDNEDVDASSIGCKVDVFALGLLFHQVFTGTLPTIASSDCHFACEARLNNVNLGISHSIAGPFRDIIVDMLECEAVDRPTMAEVHQRLWRLMYGSMPIGTDGGDASAARPTSPMNDYFSTPDGWGVSAPADTSISRGDSDPDEGSRVRSRVRINI